LFLYSGIKNFEHKSNKKNKQNLTFDLSEPLYSLVTDILDHLYPDHFKKLNDIYSNLKKIMKKKKNMLKGNSVNMNLE
jgi:hypothetical protein